MHGACVRVVIACLLFWLLAANACYYLCAQAVFIAHEDMVPVGKAMSGDARDGREHWGEH
jgi:hypothetical protein